MAKLSGYTCDGGCGTQAVTKPHESRPDGWMVLYGDSQPAVHVCSWACLAAVVHEAVGDTRTLRPAR